MPDPMRIEILKRLFTPAQEWHYTHIDEFTLITNCAVAETLDISRAVMRCEYCGRLPKPGYQSCAGCGSPLKGS
jgi:hypothetical protein